MGVFQTTGTDCRIRTSTDPDGGPNYSVSLWVDIGTLDTKRICFLNNVLILDINPLGTLRVRDSGATVFATFTSTITTGLHHIVVSLKSTRVEAWIDKVSIGAVVPTSIGNATGFHLNETAGVGFADVKYGPCNVWTRFVEPWQVATMYATRISTFAYNSLQIKWDFNEGAAGTTIANSQVVNIHDPTYNSLSQGANTPEYGDNEMAIKYRRRVA